MIQTPNFYVGLALVFFILTVVLLWKISQGGARTETLEEDRCAWNLDSFQVATRIFDPADYLWLRDDLRLPLLARELERSRKRLASQWLADVVIEYREIVAGPRKNSVTTSPLSVPVEVSLLRQTVTFYALIALARLTISLFGPYTKLNSILWAYQYAASLGDMRKGFVNSHG